jgi:hypothetical protein
LRRRKKRWSFSCVERFDAVLVSRARARKRELGWMGA